MKNLSKPLTEKELDRLDNFLLDRIDEDADTEGKDEGVLGISTLDGLFTAIVSGPVTIVPSRWLPAVWGDFEPVWESEKEFEAIFALMIRHMNSISVMLMESPEDFEPIFMERTVKGKTYTVVDEWCEGYWLGVTLAAEHWNPAMERLLPSMAPIASFAEVTNWRGHELSIEEAELIQNGIAPSAREIHAYWLEQRSQAVPAARPARNSEFKVGRNDPCPCGSGKKYKKCCLKDEKIVPLH
ncbi:MAG: UPF0149 family protein [Desulfurivibrionaceae bacterium]|nr:UPF0149 family protein [Desulfurivibrionaceae bacterium]